MRIIAESLREEAAAGGTPLHEIYGMVFASNPEKFRFLSGEVMCLLDLADVMKKKGIKYFLNDKQKPTPATSVELYNDDAKKHSRTLYEKIMQHFTLLDMTDELLEQLKTIKIKVFSNGGGRFRAEALCPICEASWKRSKLSFSMDQKRNWHIYSLTRHSSTMHFPLSECSSRKRRRTDGPTVTSSVTGLFPARLGRLRLPETEMPSTSGDFKEEDQSDDEELDSMKEEIIIGEEHDGDL
ncbi:uncharacterized protein LOC128732516 isoform X2 [Sabethes cyaneus]|nr:uncharacterized protein LOC128732516 isoform X2 [Sabethes cyaneus]